MASESGHAPDRWYSGRDGALYLNGAALYNEDGDAIPEIKTSDTLIGTAAVKTLNNTAVSLVAAPGSGIYLEFVRAYIFLDHAGTDYDGIAAGEDLIINYTDKSGDAASGTIEATGFMDASADALAIALPAIEVVAVVNAALALFMLTGEIATGNSPLKIRTLYREIAVADLIAIA